MLLEGFIVTTSLLLGIFTCFILFHITWRYRAEKCAKYFLLLLLAAFIWSIGYFFEILLSNEELVILVSKIEYLGIVTIPVAWFSFSAAYTNRFSRIVDTKLFYLLMIIPLITVILVSTNEYHGLIWRDKLLLYWYS